MAERLSNFLVEPGRVVGGDDAGVKGGYGGALAGLGGVIELVPSVSRWSRNSSVRSARGGTARSESTRSLRYAVVRACGVTTRSEDLVGPTHHIEALVRENRDAPGARDDRRRRVGSIVVRRPVRKHVLWRDSATGVPCEWATVSYVYEAPSQRK